MPQKEKKRNVSLSDQCNATLQKIQTTGTSMASANDSNDIDIKDVKQNFIN